MSRGVAAVPDAELYDLSLAQHAALPGGESGDDAGLLRPALTQSLEFDQISLTLQQPKPRGAPPRAILHQVSGACFPGSLLAIMGATGSGKTSIMNILARRLVLSKGLSVHGTVRLNGSPRPHNWKSNYVEQHDLLFGELTVRETLLFSARLRLPADTPPAARRARVDAVVRTLGLRACADTRVGSGLARGISGGERKRLALGVELVINPPLLFLDEPTSGLDAFNAQAVMSSLKLLASTGRAVVACLHQPRSSITTLFDALLLLSEGRVMFSGAAPDALPFFQRWGFACPEHTNPSDFYLDAISLSFHSPQAEAASRARVALLADAYASEQPAQLAALRAAARKAAAGDASAHALTESVVVPMDGPAADDKGNGSADSSVNVRHPRTVLRVLRRRSLEWGALASRAGRLAARQRLENAINLIRTCVFSVLLGLIWLNVGRKHTGAPSELRNLGGLLFFSIVNHSFSSVFAVVFVFAGECRLILRERVAGMYGVLPYFVSHLVAELPRNALWTLLHSVIIYWVVGLRANANAFFIFVAIHLLVSLNAEGLTLLFTAMTRSEKLASALAPIPLVLNILFGGFFTAPGAIPVWLRWLRYVAFMRWSYVALVRNEMHGRVFDCPPEASGATAGGACVPNGAVATELLVPDAQLGVAACAWVLTGFALACWVCTYAVLRVNKPRYDSSV